MKRNLIFASVVFAMYTAAITAAPLTPDEAVVAARKVLAPSTRSTASELQLKYTARLNDRNDFYIFADNESGAFSIVSADTRLPEVLGYSLSGGFDADNLPCNLKWWLDSYADQIDCWLSTNPPEVPGTRAVAPSDNRKYVAPFIKTKWNQSAPYNRLCPTIGGRQAPTGCVATAMAQAMKYYNWPPQGQGSRNDFDFNKTFEWDNMLDVYDESSNYTHDQANAVAQLMICAGRSVDMMYAAWASGAVSSREQYALPTYFDYSKGLRFIQREYYSQSEWDDIIYAEVAANRPVIYGGSSSEGGHAFVCDGYSEGYFHINWGWGGMSDGYFLLYALNPSQNGIGGFEGGYNSHQTAIIYLEKNNGEGEMQKSIIAEGAFIYSDGYFRSRGVGNEQSIFYNNLSESMSIYVGVRALDTDGKLIGDFFDPELAELQGFYGFQGYSVDISGIADGEYRLYPVYRIDGTDEVRPMLIPYGKQQYVTLIVKDGKQEYINDGVPVEMRGDLLTSDVHISPYASTDCPGNFYFYANNIGSGDFSGNIYLRILDADDNLVIDYSDNYSIPSRTSQLITLSTVLDIPQGEYSVVVEDEYHNALSQKTRFTVGNTFKPDITTPLPLAFEITGPAYSDELSCTVTTMLRNNSDDNISEAFVLRLLSADGKTVVSEGTSQPLYIPANYRNTFSLSGFRLASVPGDYVLQIFDSEDNTLSAPFPIRLEGSKVIVLGNEPDDEIYVNGVSENSVAVAHPVGGEYADKVVIGETIDTGEKVTSLQGNAFVFATALKELTLPASVSRIGCAAFYKADNLSLIRINSMVPPEIASNVMPAERFPQVVLDVPSTAANTYKRTEVWSRFNVPGWELSLPSDVSVVSGLDKDSDGAVFSPYYTGVGKPLEFELQLPSGLVFRIDLTYPSGAKKTLVSEDGRISLPGLGSGVGSAVITAADPAGVESIAENEVSAIYDIQGRLIRFEATADDLNQLPAGIYIFGSKPVIVK